MNTTNTMMNAMNLNTQRIESFKTRRAQSNLISKHQLLPLAFIHPAFRRFFRRPKPLLKRCWKNRLSIAIRIKNRTLRYHPLPRVAPFYCQKCRFSSYFAYALKNHICSRRASTVYSFEREEKIAASGFRSKSKNALSVIERAGNPSAFTITRPHSSIAEPTQPSYNVPNLSELAYRAINADRNEVNYPTNFIFERCKTTRRPYASSVTHRRNVVYCKHCKLLFYERNDFYEHFKQSSCAMPACAEDIIHVQCRGAECIPAEYEYGRRSCLITLQSNATMECTACGLSSREFSSCADFHRHLFNCDSTTINQQIKQSRNVTNYNSQQITH